MLKIIIDTKHLIYNFLTLRSLLNSQVQIMAVVKSDAYGHGIVEVAKALQRAGCVCFGVNDINEGMQLRENRISGRIILLNGGELRAVPAIIHYKLEPVLYDDRQLSEFIAASTHFTDKLSIHYKIDTGMGRLGFSLKETPKKVRSILECNNLKLIGLMSHFSSADTDLELTRMQNDHFAEIVKEIKTMGVQPQCHIANSAALLAGSHFHWDMVRPGIALYGYSPINGADCDRFRLKPVMTVSSEILQVKEVSAGRGISYGQTYFTCRPSKIAVIATGYNEGYSRNLSSMGQALVHGKRVDVIGRVCMNMTIIDVTDIHGVSRGDEVVLLGSMGQEMITADDIAIWQGSISYEVLCNFGSDKAKFYQPEQV